MEIWWVLVVVVGGFVGYRIKRGIVISREISKVRNEQPSGSCVDKKTNTWAVSYPFNWEAFWYGFTGKL